MTINKLTAGYKGNPLNSKGSDVANAVNALIDKVDKTSLFELEKPCVLSCFGNSIVAGVSGYKVFDAGISSSGNGFQFGVNYGVAGNTSADMLARVNTVTVGDAVIISEGPNDYLVSVASHRDNYNAILDNILSRDITPVISASSPRNNYGGKMAEFRSAEMVIAYDRKVDFIDPWINLSDAAGGWVSGSTSDGVHPNASTSLTAITNIRDQLKGLSAVKLFVPRDSAAGVGGYILSGGNCLMEAVTNNVANGWSMIGSTPLTPSIQAATDGYRGNFQVGTSNGTGGNPYFRKRVSGGSWQAGDELFVSMTLSFEYAANSNLTISLSGGVTKTLISNANYDIPLTRMLLSCTVSSSADIDLFVQVGNSGSGAVVKFGEFEIYNITALRSR